MPFKQHHCHWKKNIFFLVSSLQIAIRQNFKTWEVHFSWLPGCFNDAVEIEHDFGRFIIGCDKILFLMNHYSNTSLTVKNHWKDNGSEGRAKSSFSYLHPLYLSPSSAVSTFKQCDVFVFARYFKLNCSWIVVWGQFRSLPCWDLRNSGPQHSLIQASKPLL